MDNSHKKMEPYVQKEFALAKQLAARGDNHKAFIALENAHVLGQHSTVLHVKSHLKMLQWAISQNDLKEALGQVLRIIGAATKTFVGLVPSGNTGGANVSPFKAMPLSDRNKRIIKLVNES